MHSLTNGAVELFGLCGSGKSTLSHTLLSSPDRETFLRPERPIIPTRLGALLMTAKLVGSYGLRDPFSCASLLKSSAGRWLFYKLGYRMSGLHLRGDLEGSLLVDSGVLQPLISCEIEYNLALIDWNVEQLVEVLPLPSRAIYVRVGPETALKRYLERGSMTGRGVQLKGIEHRFERGFQVAEDLYLMCRDGGVRCVVYDNEDEISLAGVARIRSSISSDSETLK